MFESLSDRLSGILDKLTRRGALSEADVGEALREARAVAELGTWTAAAKERLELLNDIMGGHIFRVTNAKEFEAAKGATENTPLRAA